MIDSAMLSSLRQLVARCEADLAKVITTRPADAARLRELHAALRQRKRTAEELETFVENHLRQVAVHTVLSLVFVRWLEDHGHLRTLWVAAEGDDKDRVDATYGGYFAKNPTHGDDDYLAALFDSLASSGPVGAIFARERNLLWDVPVSADNARELLLAFRATDDGGRLRLRFATPNGDTRLLGDLYQDLSEAARDRYALLQTPDFVEAFLLDLTLTPAIEELGADAVSAIDPTCGSGHLVLGAARRIFEAKRDAHPAQNASELVVQTLAQVAGVDVNPFAALITRFRLSVWAMRTIGGTRLLTIDAVPAYSLNVACADSLLAGRRGVNAELGLGDNDLSSYALPGEVLRVEDTALADQVLSRRYAVVVGNPPYITVRDKQLNETIRAVYPRSCSGQYSLVAPFIERFFDLASSEHGQGAQGLIFGEGVSRRAKAGWVALIVSNAFTKREFGAKVIEGFLPTVDVTHVVDTSGAYIPGHGTPTLILGGRHRKPATPNVRAVLGTRGEPGTPAVPAEGKVWSSIAENIANAGFENAYITVTDVARTTLAGHPWSLRGGGALELKDLITASQRVLESEIAAIGRTGNTGADHFFLVGGFGAKNRMRGGALMALVTGDCVRDFRITMPEFADWPYDSGLVAAPSEGFLARAWPVRTTLASRVMFGAPITESARWFDWLELYRNKLATPLSITFAFVATHNHFVLDRGGKVFNRSAPVIKLAPDAIVDDHLALLGCFNSSVGGFWMKMVFFDKGIRGEGGGLTPDTWERFYEFDSTKLAHFPLPADRPTKHAALLDALAQLRSFNSPEAVTGRSAPTAATLDAAREAEDAAFCWMVALQEELDWAAYTLYGVTEAGDNLALDEVMLPQSPEGLDASVLPPIRPGQRAFEVVLARAVARGEVETQWFARHNIEPITELPGHWPPSYRQMVKRRIAAIEAMRFVRLLEQPEYKRRWSTDAWEARERLALRNWMLDHLESDRCIAQAPDAAGARPTDPERAQAVTIGELADIVAADAAFAAVAARYRGGHDIDFESFVRDLLAPETVAALPGDRLKPSGLNKLKRWERTWELQRLEDAIEARTQLPETHPDHLTRVEAHSLRDREVGKVPVPPDYSSADMKGNAWTLRGKLDVPRERFVELTGAADAEDRGPALLWAGLDHRQRAEAIVAWYGHQKRDRGADATRLRRLLVMVVDLLPWLRQWHDAEFADAVTGFVNREAAELGVTYAQLEEERSVASPAPARGRMARARK